MNDKDKERKFNFCIEDMIQQNINEKKEITYKSLCRYLSIPEEEKREIIESAKQESLVPTTLKGRVKRKSRRLA